MTDKPVTYVTDTDPPEPLEDQTPPMAQHETEAYRAFQVAAAELKTATDAVPAAQEKFRAALAALAEVAAPTKAP